MKKSFLIWLGSIATFFVTAYAYKPPTGLYTSFQYVIFLIAIFVGIVAFLIFLAIFIKKHKKLLLNARSIYPAIILIALPILILSNMVLSKSIALKSNINIIPTPSPYVYRGPTFIPTTEPTSAYVPQAPATVAPQPSDLITCRSAQCGSVTATRAECQAAVCCEVGNGWYWYRSNDRCDSAQKDYWTAYYNALYSNSSTSNYVPVIPVQSDYIPDYSNTIKDFQNYTQKLQEDTQKANTDSYNQTMQGINNDINNAKDSIKPAPSPVTALCADGTYSYADHNSGACSSHGGVQIWY